MPLEAEFGLLRIVVGGPLDDGLFHGGESWTTVLDGLFEVFFISVRRGRVFTERDGRWTLPVVVIKKAMALRRRAGNEDAALICNGGTRDPRPRSIHGRCSRPAGIRLQTRDTRGGCDRQEILKSLY